MIAFFCALLLFLDPAPWIGNISLPTGVIAQAHPVAQIARATTTTPQQALERLFTSSEIQTDWFIPSFLEQVPPNQIQAVLSNMASSLGEFQSVRQMDDGFEVQFTRGTVPAQIRLTADGQIAGLFFEPPSIPVALDQAIALLESSPYDTSFLVTKDGTDVAELNAETPLAVGSTFKLAVLAALKNQIDAGTLSWDTVVELQPDLKSLPSGMMQDWPDGSKVTLDTLATLMISISDNTATDVLIHTIGRENIEALTERNQPLLTTKEAFTLKNPDNAWLLRRYRNGTIDAQRQVLQDSGDRPLPSKNTFTNEPVEIDVEWFFTPRELCRLMETVADLPAMQINSGAVNPSDWEQVAFKGGSEPGVLNLTTQVQNAEGQTYCISATWNSAEQPLNEEVLTQLYRSMISGLAQS
ncbi:MAG: serine hydrolase [Cyanobacteria bacterium P01_E01_bin.6]